MKKILFFSFFLTILFSQLFAVENKSIQKFIGCDNEIDEDYFHLRCNDFRSPHLWKEVDGKWHLRHTVNKDGVDD